MVLLGTLNQFCANYARGEPQLAKICTRIIATANVNKDSDVTANSKR